MVHDLQYYTNRIETAMREHSIHPSHFGKNIWDSLKLTDVEVKEDAGRKSCKVVMETVVARDMLNPVGVMHGAVGAFLLDTCTSVPLMALGTSDFWPGLGGLSQAMHILYHAPAPEGTTLKIVCETLNVGKAVANMRCEIKDAKTDRLFVSGTHTKVDVYSRQKEKEKAAGKVKAKL